MRIEAGVNLEFIRCEEEPFEAGVARAAALGFRWVEPIVHNGRELLSGTPVGCACGVLHVLRAAARA